MDMICLFSRQIGDRRQETGDSYYVSLRLYTCNSGNTVVL